ncbi:hypothetical protein [Streptomyces sp. NBC_00658]|uniref:hypothetical protein n=1 Tax=Streptomyces sp. NBC_00658 TaxID=2975800 RepID=UPI003251CDFB
MDLQGIGAVAAAGAALVSVLVGHRQVKAAIQTAEATYRSAVDAARTQGLNEHNQWRRTVRREVYAALLQAVLNHTDHAGKVFSQGAEDPRRAQEVFAASEPLATDMSHKKFVVRLEGPDEVSTAAQALITSAENLMDVCRVWAVSQRARSLLDDRAAAYPQEVERVREITAAFRVEGYWSLIGTPQMPDEANAMLGELRPLMRRIDVSLGYMSHLCTVQSATAYGDASHALDSAIGEFITEARMALDEVA